MDRVIATVVPTTKRAHRSGKEHTAHAPAAKERLRSTPVRTTASNVVVARYRTTVGDMTKMGT
jgi:hypothetical protein